MDVLSLAEQCKGLGSFSLCPKSEWTGEDTRGWKTQQGRQPELTKEAALCHVTSWKGRGGGLGGI